MSIVDLIDAQRNALVAEQRSANAVYDFLIDLMEVERAAGFLSSVTSEEDLEAFLSTEGGGLRTRALLSERDDAR